LNDIQNETERDFEL